MMLIVKYITEEEAEQIILNMRNQGYRLVEVSNITEGNFLGFVPIGEKLSPDSPMKIEFDKLQRQIDELTLILGDVLLEGGL